MEEEIKQLAKDTKEHKELMDSDSGWEPQFRLQAMVGLVSQGALNYCARVPGEFYNQREQWAMEMADGRGKVWIRSGNLVPAIKQPWGLGGSTQGTSAWLTGTAADPSGGKERGGGGD